jgi:hypothetical protein
VKDADYSRKLDDRGRDFGHRQFLLKAIEENLEAADKKGRDSASKRWQANCDFIMSRVLAQRAYCSEMDSAVGLARRKDMPDRDATLQQNGWRMAATAKPGGDKEGKEFAKKRLTLLKKMEDEYKGTPWEVVARREEFAALGVEWQPAQLGGK